MTKDDSESTSTPRQPGRPEKPLISVVFSFRNEEAVIPELIARLQKVLRSLPVRYELIFVNDASTDRSLRLLAERAKEDGGIKVLTMSRHSGSTNACSPAIGIPPAMP